MTINYQQPFPYGPFVNQIPYPVYQEQPKTFENPALQTYYSQQSYVENILRLNKGKIATIYMNFEDSQWGSKIFRGEIIGAGRDHIILHDIQNKVNYLLLTVYLSYVSFDETIEYDLSDYTPSDVEQKKQ